MPSHVTPEQIQRYREQLTENLQRSVHANWNSMDYLNQSQQELTLEEYQPPITRHMPYLPAGQDVLGPGEEMAHRRESHSEKKQRESLEKQRRKALEAMQKADMLEGSDETRSFRANRLIRLNRIGDTESPMSKKELQQEQAILDARLNAISQKEQSDIQEAEMGGPINTETEKQIRLTAQDRRVTAYHTIASQMPLGSKERTKLMEKKEQEVLKADQLRRELKVARMPEGTEKNREAATIKRHAWFDDLKKIFRKPSPYSHEDAVVSMRDKVLVNKGRATLGGTKAMYVFEERDQQGIATGQDWLFKEATNCVGMAKPEGAVVTDEASKLQQLLRGSLSIPAECLKVNGKVVGSIQKRMQKAEGGLDLFKWQAQDHLTELPETTMRDLMHEHTLDWILCNFDTKGENFINQPEGHIISFDKEASFNTLLQEGSRHISYTFKPHSNDTIYNTMFRAFAQGKINLDLDANLESIRKLEEMNGDDFIAMFRETLATKYGNHTDDRKEAERLLRKRHHNLRNEYRAFYTKLIKERIDSIHGHTAEDQRERERLDGMLIKGAYVFADEREPELPLS